MSGLFFFGAEVFGEGDLLELLLRRILLLGLGVRVLDWEDLGRGESLESKDSVSDNGIFIFVLSLLTLSFGL